MARYEHLHIYKEAYQLSLTLFQIVSKFSRDYKYTLGDKIIKNILSILSNIVLINSTQGEDRQKYFFVLDEAIFELNLLINISNDLKIFGKPSQVITLLESIIKIKKMKQSWQ